MLERSMRLRHEFGDALWAQGAGDTPETHSDEVWRIIATSYYPEGSYPANSYKDVFHLCIRENGEVLSYSMTRRITHFPTNKHHGAQYPD